MKQSQGRVTRGEEPAFVVQALLHSPTRPQHQGPRGRGGDEPAPLQGETTAEQGPARDRGSASVSRRGPTGKSLSLQAVGATLSRGERETARTPRQGRSRHPLPQLAPAPPPEAGPGLRSTRQLGSGYWPSTYPSSQLHSPNITLHSKGNNCCYFL